jgi:hypothetical protein
LEKYNDEFTPNFFFQNGKSSHELFLYLIEFESEFEFELGNYEYDYVFPGKNIAAEIAISQNQLDFGDLMTSPSLS